MKPVRLLVLATIFGTLWILPANAPAQQKASDDAPTVNPDFRVDGALAETGRQLFVRKDCQGCHTIGRGRAAGPDLSGAAERRTIDWLKQFLKNTSQMLDADPIAQAMLRDHRNFRMPDVPLNDAEIDALIHYIQHTTMQRRQ